MKTLLMLLLSLSLSACVMVPTDGPDHAPWGPVEPMHPTPSHYPVPQGGQTHGGTGNQPGMPH